MNQEIQTIENVIKTHISDIMVDENKLPYTKYDYSILQYATNPPFFMEATIADIPMIMRAGTLWLSDIVDQFIHN